MHLTTTFYKKDGAKMELTALLAIVRRTVVPVSPAQESDGKIEVFHWSRIDVGVLREEAESQRQALIGILNESQFTEKLKGAADVTYIEFGAMLGSQELALQLFALGMTLKIWQVITPWDMGFSGDLASELAGQGYIGVIGYNPH